MLLAKRIRDAGRSAGKGLNSAVVTSGAAVAAGALAALDKAVRTRFGSWLGVVRIG